MNESLLPRIQGVLPDEVFRLTIPGEPKSKQRPRFAKGRAYTPTETVTAEKAIAAAWRDAGFACLSNPLLVELTFYNGNRRRRDLDNMVKLVLDGLNRVAFDDDVQVVELNARKIFTEKIAARTEIVLRELLLWPCE